MSILNVCLEPTRALVCVDTKGSYAKAGHCLMSKAHVFCHASALLAGVGSAMFLNGLHYQLNELPLPGFDEMVDAMPDAIGKIYPGFAHAVQQGSVSAERGAARQVVNLVGWSRRRNRMCVVAWGQEAGEGFVETESDDGWHHVPPLAVPLKPGGALKDFIVGLAKLQTAEYLAKDPEFAIGGELVVFEIQRTEIRMHRICSL